VRFIIPLTTNPNCLCKLLLEMLGKAGYNLEFEALKDAKMEHQYLWLMKENALQLQVCG
jgi:hypothetical protein